jgi:uncharacterized repeat protein (TIGR01451 family)/MYXO-CTERM domain-containing protein
LLGVAAPYDFSANNPEVPALTNERSGHDNDPASPEIKATFNSAYGTTGCGPGWYHGLDNQPPGDTADLVTVLLHEFGHGLGFVPTPSYYAQARDDVSGQLLSELDAAGFFAAVRHPLQVGWVGPAVQAVRGEFLTTKDGVLQLGTGSSYPLNLASFGPPGASFSNVMLVRAQDASGSGATNACGPIVPATGKLVIADRDLNADGSLTCLVSDRALNAQQAGAVGLIVRHSAPGGIPISYVGDPATPVTIPVWGISQEDGTAVEAALGSGATVSLDAAGRQAGEDASGHPLLYTPSVFLDGSSVSHWDVTAKPHLLMQPAIGPSARHLDLTPAALGDVGWSVVQGPSVGATKLSRSDIALGQPILFIIQVANRSASPATGVVLDQILDPGLSFTSSSGDCTSGFPCNLGTLEPWAVRTVIATYALQGAQPTGVAQTFQITAGSPAPSSTARSATVLASHLALTATGPTSGTAGTSGTYSFSLHNEGQDSVNGILVQHALSGPGTARAIGGDCGGTDTCRLVAIGPGQTRHWTLSVDYTGAGTVTITGAIPGATAGTPDVQTVSTQISAAAAKSGCSVVPGAGPESALLPLAFLALLAARRRKPGG